MEANKILFELERIGSERTLYKNWMQGDDLSRFLAAGKSLLSKAQLALAEGKMPYKIYKDVEAAYSGLVANVKQINGEDALTRRQKTFPRKMAGKAMLITASAIDATKKNKKTWYNLAIADKDNSGLTEKQLGAVEKHDVIDLGRRNEECDRITEGQFGRGEEAGKAKEIIERQLAEAQVGEEVLILTEGRMNDSSAPSSGARNEDAWMGDDIKIYREVNRRQRENAKANLAFYKDHPEKTEGGKGTVSASSWKQRMRRRAQ